MNSRSVVALTLAMLLGFVSIVSAQTGSWRSSAQKPSEQNAGPLPAPSIEGLDEYQKQIMFASRNIEEGDFSAAEENLKAAEKLKKDDPLLYEMFGIVYDADRQSEKAFEYFKKAGDMYLDRGNIDKAWKMLGWIRTLDTSSKDVVVFENKIRKRQEVINRR